MAAIVFALRTVRATPRPDDVSTHRTLREAVDLIVCRTGRDAGQVARMLGSLEPGRELTIVTRRGLAAGDFRDVAVSASAAEPIVLSPAELAEARGWLSDCEWSETAGMTGAEMVEWAYLLSDATVTRGIERHYEGGLAAFVLATGLRQAIDVSGLARHPAGTCDGCGHDAVELASWVEDDGGSGQRLSYCRPCMGEDAGDPSVEWIEGEPVDAETDRAQMLAPEWEPCGRGCACSRLTSVCRGPLS